MHSFQFNTIHLKTKRWIDFVPFFRWACTTFLINKHWLLCFAFDALFLNRNRMSKAKFYLFHIKNGTEQTFHRLFACWLEKRHFIIYSLETGCNFIFQAHWLWREMNIFEMISFKWPDFTNEASTSFEFYLLWLDENAYLLANEICIDWNELKFMNRICVFTALNVVVESVKCNSLFKFSTKYLLNKDRHNNNNNW